MDDGLLTRLRTWVNEGQGRTIALSSSAGAVVLATVLSVWLFARAGTTPRQAVKAEGRAVTFVCKGCGERGETRVTFGATYPIKCPKCGEVKGVKAFKCVRCSTIVEHVPNGVSRCPKCGFAYKSLADDQPRGRPPAGAAGKP